MKSQEKVKLSDSCKKEANFAKLPDTKITFLYEELVVNGIKMRPVFLSA